VNIRPATVADIPALIDLERQCATAAHWTEQQYRRLFQTDERLLLVAETLVPIAFGPEPDPDSTRWILGFLIARHLAPEWELENIVVAPMARQKGLGKRLFEALLAAARETNSSSVFLEVRESNAAARTLYERVGFEQTGRRKSYYTDPLEDAVLYRRTVG
jgi:[ribosomal protein S18]-alanine N-acetyltransferase